ncbi:MAG: TetR/AcrR family transcriptional regulator [Porticoccaceae bacterium]
MPTRKKQTSAAHEVRKAPRQQRAIATVEGIKTAVLKLADKQGFADITITQIAEQAGIGKGSLYQYFSGRDAIYLALFEDAGAEMTAIMKDLYVRILDLPARQGVSTVLRRHLDFVRRHELVFLVMPGQVPHLQLTSHPITYENLIIRFTRNYIEEICPGLSSQEIAHRAFFVHEIAKSCIYRFVSDPPEKMSDKAFIDALSTLIADYLTKGVAQ